MALPPGICSEWFTVADICSDDENVEVAQRCVDAATSWAFRATCSQFVGACASVIRPAGRCGHSGRCGCDNEWLRNPRGGWREKIDLSPMVPGRIRQIVDVQVDGVAIAPEDYRLSRGRYLVPHVDGDLWPWPLQDLNLPDGEDGTWSVTVEHGNDPPPDLIDAAAELASQMLAHCLGGDCDLPDNATSISKDGMTLQLSVPTNGNTGMPMVDSVLALYGCRSRRRMLDPAEPLGDVARTTLSS